MAGKLDLDKDVRTYVPKWPLKHYNSQEVSHMVSSISCGVKYLMWCHASHVFLSSLFWYHFFKVQALTRQVQISTRQLASMMGGIRDYSKCHHVSCLLFFCISIHFEFLYMLFFGVRLVEEGCVVMRWMREGCVGVRWMREGCVVVRWMCWGEVDERRMSCGEVGERRMW